MFTRVAADQPFDTNKDASPSRLVSERVDPPRVLIGLLYSHGDIVARGLHVSITGVLHCLTLDMSSGRRSAKPRPLPVRSMDRLGRIMAGANATAPAIRWS